MTATEQIVDRLILGLPALSAAHSPTCDTYRLLDGIARAAIDELFGPSSSVQEPCFGPFGALRFPFTRMGTISSLELFDLDELIIFSFYWKNRCRYAKVLDLGANLGLHSLVLSRCGYEVTAYEPDPVHFAQLTSNLSANDCGAVSAKRAAVSTRAGELEFVRVLGNTTSSHLAGAKPHPYGELERFPVLAEAFAPMLRGIDLVKMDVEGHEADLLRTTAHDDWLCTDAIVEIGSADNAAAVFGHFKAERVNLFAQKGGWRRVECLEDMPTSYHEGSLFISMRDEIPW